MSSQLLNDLLPQSSSSPFLRKFHPYARPSQSPSSEAQWQALFSELLLPSTNESLFIDQQHSLLNTPSSLPDEAELESSCSELLSPFNCYDLFALDSPTGTISPALIEAHRYHPIFPNDAMAAKIQNYLNEYQPDVLLENECSLIIMTARVGQKSYGTEKRFLCPPPTIILKGNAWWNKQRHFTHPTVLISLPHEEQAKKVFRYSYAAEWCNVEDVEGRLIMRNLHINDFESKHKKLGLKVSVIADGLPLGEFNSCPIKVISKPSKKRQKLKTNDLCIYHGSTVALFNRLRSQTVSTKYLAMSNGDLDSERGLPWANQTSFITRGNMWDPFFIWMVDPSKAASLPTNDSFLQPPAIAMSPRNLHSFVDDEFANQPDAIPIAYNHPIVLQCVRTGKISPIFVIRKVEKATDNFYSVDKENCASNPEVVSQMHRIALELYTPLTNQYLSCLNDNVSLTSAEIGSFDRITDKSVWTLVGTDSITYRFYDDTEKSSLERNHTPRLFPTVFRINQFKPSEFFIHGENFSPDLTVWLGSRPCIVTEVRSPNLIRCVPPSVNSNEKVPILMVQDTCIMRTEFNIRLSCFTS